MSLPIQTKTTKIVLKFSEIQTLLLHMFAYMSVDVLQSEGISFSPPRSHKRPASLYFSVLVAVCCFFRAPPQSQLTCFHLPSRCTCLLTCLWMFCSRDQSSCFKCPSIGRSCPCTTLLFLLALQSALGDADPRPKQIRSMNMMYASTQF